jgi:hypothetical protein
MQTEHTHNDRKILTVIDDQEAGGRLLDELDDLVGVIEAAMLDQEAARMTVMETDAELEVLSAEATLGAEGSNETLRKAAVVLALRNNPEYQQHLQTNRSARAELHAAERRLAIAKLRVQLVKSALLLLIPQPPPHER